MMYVKHITLRMDMLQLYRKPTSSPIDRDYTQAIRVGPPPRGSSRGGQSQLGPNGPTQEELEEEKEEPDRLSLLLPQSRFDCVNKQTGYYADEDLNCEVFHYCQDNAKHSWICPEGFTFHQVHLICMPPSGDISCQKSSQYHFVNEYLYKPLNLQEAETKPNVTLRYSERYYPSDIYTDEREVGDYQITPTPAPVRRPAPQVWSLFFNCDDYSNRNRLEAVSAIFESEILTFFMLRNFQNQSYLRNLIIQYNVQWNNQV